MTLALSIITVLLALPGAVLATIQVVERTRDRE